MAVNHRKNKINIIQGADRIARVLGVLAGMFVGILIMADTSFRIKNPDHELWRNTVSSIRRDIETTQRDENTAIRFSLEEKKNYINKEIQKALSRQNYDVYRMLSQLMQNDKRVEGYEGYDLAMAFEANTEYQILLKNEPPRSIDLNLLEKTIKISFIIAISMLTIILMILFVSGTTRGIRWIVLCIMAGFKGEK